MRRIAIVGSGQAGLLNAHGLLKAGYQVDLYSERTGDQWFNESRPTGVAVRFGPALAYERELGLDFWPDAPGIPGVNFVLCLKPGTPFLEMNGRFSAPALAMDLRLQSRRWLSEFEKRGGKLFIERIDIPRLDQIAAEHDLTIVASGRGALSELFPVNAERSVYTEPRRHVTMINVLHPSDRRDFTRVPARLYELPSAGETIWTPYYHKDFGPSWNLYCGARFGGPLDRFQGLKSGDDVLAAFKQLIRDVYPWDWEWAKEMTVADPLGWIAGAITPTIRNPVGRLPSGRVVTFLGDTAISFDPIAAQGANNGNKMARHLTDAIVRRGGAPFDDAWIEQTFEEFYRDHGEAAFRFTNTLLEGVPPAGQEMLAAQYGSDGRSDSQDPRQKLANDFCESFCDPRRDRNRLTDVKLARECISQHMGGSASAAVMKGRLAIIGNQIRWRLGMRGRVGFQNQLWS